MVAGADATAEFERGGMAGVEPAGTGRDACRGGTTVGVVGESTLTTDVGRDAPPAGRGGIAGC